MYREICQTDLSDIHSTVWEKSPKVTTKLILLCCIENFPKKFSPCRVTWTYFPLRQILLNRKSISDVFHLVDFFTILRTLYQNWLWVRFIDHAWKCIIGDVFCDQSGKVCSFWLEDFKRVKISEPCASRSHPPGPLRIVSAPFYLSTLGQETSRDGATLCVPPLYVTDVATIFVLYQSAPDTHRRRSKHLWIYGTSI